MYEEDYEETLSLTDIAAYILHHWRPIFIWGIILMIAVGGFMSYRDYSAIQSKYADETYSEMIKDLTDEQVNNAKQFHKRYLTYRQRIDDNQFYMDNSLKMKIDPNNVSVYTVEYLVDAGSMGVMPSFINSTFQYDDYKKMADTIGNGVDARYVNELVYLSGELQQDAFDIDTDKVGDVINGAVSNSYSGILTLNITANGRETCEKLAEIADKAIMTHFDVLEKSGVKVAIKNVGSSYSEKVDMTLAESQREESDKGAQLVSDFYAFEKEAKDSLDEDEFSVFQYLVQKEQKVTEKVHWKKWCAIGLLGGLFVGFVIYVLRYLAIPGVKTTDEIKRIMTDRELGSVIQPASYNFKLGKIFHVWANWIRFRAINNVSDDEAIAIVCDRIVCNCGNNNAKKLFLVTDSGDDYTRLVVDKCVEELKKSGLDVHFGNPDTSIEALRALRTSDAAVYAVTLTKSLFDSLRGNKSICEESKITELGSFLIYPQS